MSRRVASNPYPSGTLEYNLWEQGQVIAKMYDEIVLKMARRHIGIATRSRP